MVPTEVNLSYVDTRIAVKGKSEDLGAEGLSGRRSDRERGFRWICTGHMRRFKYAIVGEARWLEGQVPSSGL